MQKQERGGGSEHAKFRARNREGKWRSNSHSVERLGMRLLSFWVPWGRGGAWYLAAREGLGSEEEEEGSGCCSA